MVKRKKKICKSENLKKFRIAVGCSYATSCNVTHIKFSFSFKTIYNNEYFSFLKACWEVEMREISIV